MSWHESERRAKEANGFVDKVYRYEIFSSGKKWGKTNHYETINLDWRYVRMEGGTDISSHTPHPLKK